LSFAWPATIDQAFEAVSAIPLQGPQHPASLRRLACFSYRVLLKQSGANVIFDFLNEHLKLPRFGYSLLPTLRRYPFFDFLQFFVGGRVHAHV
jgi:hypothetical protein